MEINEALLDYVSDGDIHTKLEGIEYSTSWREIITVEDMVNYCGKEAQDK